jgi:hypothetical protein
VHGRVEVEQIHDKIEVLAKRVLVPDGANEIVEVAHFVQQGEQRSYPALDLVSAGALLLKSSLVVLVERVGSLETVADTRGLVGTFELSASRLRT